MNRNLFVILYLFVILATSLLTKRLFKHLFFFYNIPEYSFFVNKK